MEIERGVERGGGIQRPLVGAKDLLPALCRAPAHHAAADISQGCDHGASVPRGRDPSGFDCSGFVQCVFAQQGLALPREVREQYQVGDDIDSDDIRPGDLVFFEVTVQGV